MSDSMFQGESNLVTLGMELDCKKEKTKMEKPKLKSIKIRIEVDDDPDTSTLGKYTNSLAEGVIVRKFNEFYERLTDEEKEVIPESSKEYRYFMPYACGEKVGTEEYYEYGMRDYKRTEGLCSGDWNYIGVKAEAKVTYSESVGMRRLEIFSSGGVWGIESDSKDYIKEVAKEEIEELREHLKQFNVSLVGFDKLAKEAIENIRGE